MTETVKIIPSTSSKNRISFDVDTSAFIPAIYYVEETGKWTEKNGVTSGILTFKVTGTSSPTLIPTISPRFSLSSHIPKKNHNIPQELIPKMYWYTGSITITSEPPDAEIFIEDKDTGRVTPSTIDLVRPGSHSIMLSENGFAGTEKRPVKVTEKRESTIHFGIQNTGTPFRGLAGVPVICRLIVLTCIFCITRAGKK